MTRQGPKGERLTPANHITVIRITKNPPSKTREVVMLDREEPRLSNGKRY
jgi:hypothetical protein